MSPRKSFAIALAVGLLAGPKAHAAITFFQAEASFPISPQAEFLSVADMNEDGLEDVIVISPQSDEVNILLSFPSQPSRFSPVAVDDFGSTLRRGAAADITRDDIADLVVPDQRQDGVWILVGNGEGRVTNPNFIPVGRNPYAVAIADFDGVRGNDIAVTDQRLGNVTILLNDGGSPPRFTRGPIFAVGEEPLTVLAIDVNGDDRMDLVTLNEGGPRVKSISVLVFLQVTAGLPVFAPAQNYGVGERPSQMNSADLNNDGFDDIVMLNRPTGGGNSEMDVLISRGDGVFDGPTSFEIPCPFFTGGATCRSRALALGDFDGNDTIDLAVFLSDPRRVGTGSGLENDALFIYAGRGDGQFLQGPVLRTPKSPLAAVAIDLNGDALIDLAGGFQRNSNITAFTNASTPGGGQNGDDCTVGGQCLSGICVEGVCCASACADDESCAVPNREGICVRVVPPVDCEIDDQCFDIPNEGDPGTCVDGFCCEDRCPEGRCDIAGFEGLCIPTLPPGGVCVDERDCSTGFCVDERCCLEACLDGFCGSDDGVCRTPLDPGEPCNENAECSTEICDRFTGVCCNDICTEDEECDDQGECVVANPTPGPGNPGDSCEDDNDCANQNCVNDVCCTVESCPLGDVCQPPNGECAPEPTPTQTPVPQEDGEPCDDEAECESGFCVNFVCCGVEECPDGQFCSAPDGLCVVGTPPATPTRTPVEVCRDVPCADDRVCVEIGGRGECVDECNGGFCDPDESCVPESGGGETCVDSCRDVECDNGETCVIGNSGNPVCAIPCGTGTFCEPGETCQEGEIGQPLCIRSSRSGGCDIGAGSSATDLWILTLLPAALWILRRNQLPRRALLRVRSGK